MTQGIIYQLYTLLNDYLFGGTVTWESVQEWFPLAMGLVCVTGGLLVVSIPFMIVLWFTRSLFSCWWSR